MEQIPDWSGEFWEDHRREFGYLAVWIGDERQHQPPGGWRLVRTYFSTEDEADVYVYRKVSSWLMTSDETAGIAL